MFISPGSLGDIIDTQEYECTLRQIRNIDIQSSVHDISLVNALVMA
jgi:hypothetical protein